MNWLPVLTTKNVNDAVNILNDIVRNIFDRHSPFINKRVKGRPCPWLDNSLKRKLNEQDRVLRKARCWSGNIYLVKHAMYNLNLHRRQTRNSKNFLKLPSIKLEFTKNRSNFMVLRFTMTCL